MTDEEPCDDSARGAAAEWSAPEPAANPAAASPGVAGSGGQEQARTRVELSQTVSKQTDAAQEEEDGGEEDMADFEDSAEQAHFSAFTARVRVGVFLLRGLSLNWFVCRWRETLSRCCAMASKGS